MLEKSDEVIEDWYVEYTKNLNGVEKELEWS